MVIDRVTNEPFDRAEAFVLKGQAQKEYHLAHREFNRRGFHMMTDPGMMSDAQLIDANVSDQCACHGPKSPEETAALKSLAEFQRSVILQTLRALPDYEYFLMSLKTPDEKFSKLDLIIREFRKQLEKDLFIQEKKIKIKRQVFYTQNELDEYDSWHKDKLKDIFKAMARKAAEPPQTVYAEIRSDAITRSAREGLLPGFFDGEPDGDFVLGMTRPFQPREGHCLVEIENDERLSSYLPLPFYYRDSSGVLQGGIRYGHAFVHTKLVFPALLWSALKEESSPDELFVAFDHVPPKHLKMA